MDTTNTTLFSLLTHTFEIVGHSHEESISNLFILLVTALQHSLQTTLNPKIELRLQQAIEKDNSAEVEKIIKEVMTESTTDQVRFELHALVQDYLQSIKESLSLTQREALVALWQ